MKLQDILKMKNILFIIILLPSFILAKKFKHEENPFVIISEIRDLSNFDLPEWGDVKNDFRNYDKEIYWKGATYLNIDGYDSNDEYMNNKWKKISKKSFYQNLLFIPLFEISRHNKYLDSLKFQLNNYKTFDQNKINLNQKIAKKNLNIFIDHSYYFLQIINNNFNVFKFERGNIFQTQLRNIVIGIVLIFSDYSYNSYRFADALCTSFYPSYLSNTNTFIMEDLTHYRGGSFNNLEIYFDSENTVISKEEVIHFTGKESSDINWSNNLIFLFGKNGLDINTLVKYLRYILSFFTLLIIFFVIKKIKNKRISNEI